MMHLLAEAIRKKQAPVVVGLDPQTSFIPERIMKEAFAAHGETLEGVSSALYRFNKEIVDAVCDLVPAVKPQIAMYERFGVAGVQAYQDTIDYCRQKGLIVIGDVKRGDIGSTAAAYADGHLGEVAVGKNVFRPFDTDIVTVNPYLGSDGVQPFIDVCKAQKRAIFVLVKTSNPSSGEFQDRLIDGKPLYEHVAERVARWGDDATNDGFFPVGAVCGATYPEVGARLRELMPRTMLLVPGYGTQGATAKDLKPFFLRDGTGAIVNSSRGIIAAWQSARYGTDGATDVGDAARRATIDTIREITDACC